jgi:diacylglycerol O-acyltransferase / wax synthase
MSGAETMMWNIERDPWLASTSASVALYDRPIDFERFRRAMAHTVATTARLRQHVVAGRPPATPPHWAADVDFDLDWHVRRIGAPGEGTVRDLFDWASQYLQDPFDRTRPLWQYVVIDRLADGRGAMVAKLHHTLADGHSAVQLALGFTTLERDAPQPPEIDLDTVIREQPEDHDGLASDTLEVVVAAMRWPLGLARRVVDMAVHPEQLVAAGLEAADLVRTTADQLHPAGSALWQPRSRRRRVQALSVPFDEAHQAARALGGTLNDFFMTGAAEAAHRYHSKFGACPQRFHITFVVSTRTDASGQNAFTPVPVEVPGGPMDLAERFTAVQAMVRHRRNEVHGSGPIAAVATLANLVPVPLMTSFIRSQARHIDFGTTNVAGFPGDTYVAGARTLHVFVFGPLAGTAFFVTQLSVAGSLDIGLHLDPAAVTDPALLRSLLEDSYRDLIAAGGVGAGRD